MKSFTDAENRQWTISVDPVSVDLVRSRCDVDLFEVGAVAQHDNPQDSVEWQLTGNPLLFCRVMWELLVDPPADIDFNSFARAIRSDALACARDALWDEIVNFTPDPEERRVRKAMQEKMKALMKQGMERLHQLIESPELEQRLAGELERLDDRFTNLLDELASLQDDSSPQPTSP